MKVHLIGRPSFDEVAAVRATDLARIVGAHPPISLDRRLDAIEAALEDAKE